MRDLESMELRIHGMRQAVHLGWSDEERSQPQTVELELLCEVNPAPEVILDDTNGVVNYEGIVSAVRSLCSEVSWKLLEKMAFDVAQQILHLSPRIAAVEAQVTKFVFPQTSGVSVKTRVSRT